MVIYFNGLALGLSLVMALGPQNVFLIRQGARRKHAALSALTCFFCDLILISASIAGLHQVLTKHPVFQLWMTWFGAAFLLYYGVSALRKALLKTPPQQAEDHTPASCWQIILLALGFSLLNPHAIIDSLVIIGGGSSQFPDHQWAFMLGVVTSSLLWFVSLTITTHYFADILARANIWRCIELSSGLLMVFLSIKLTMS